MELDKYEYLANETFALFTFSSIGPNGVIKKVVKYRHVGRSSDGLPLYNLSFGDWDETMQDIDDTTVSNNADRDKVLATVASTILVFVEHYSKAAVVASGVTPVKTRLYQMGINAHRTEVEKFFTIYGLFQGTWVEFKSGCNYNAFMVVKK